MRQSEGLSGTPRLSISSESRHIGDIEEVARASLGFAVFGRTQVDVFGVDVNGHQISVSKAHPAFVDALARSNPPGWVQLEGAAAPQHYHQPQPSTYDPVTGYRPPDRQA